MYGVHEYEVKLHCMVYKGHAHAYKVKLYYIVHKDPPHMHLYTMLK